MTDPVQTAECRDACTCGSYPNRFGFEMRMVMRDCPEHGGPMMLSVWPKKAGEDTVEFWPEGHDIDGPDG